MNTLGGVVLPKIRVQEGDPFVAGGRFIDRWMITVPYMTYEEFLLLEDVARTSLVDTVERTIDGTGHTNGGAKVELRLSEWDENVTKHVYITGFRHERTPLQGPTSWDKSGRTVELELEEA